MYFCIYLLCISVFVFFLNYSYFYEDHIGYKCTFLYFNVLILGNSIYICLFFYLLLNLNYV